MQIDFWPPVSHRTKDRRRSHEHKHLVRDAVWDKRDPSLKPVTGTIRDRPWNKPAVFCVIARLICRFVPFVPGTGRVRPWDNRPRRRVIKVFMCFLSIGAFRSLKEGNFGNHRGRSEKNTQKLEKGRKPAVWPFSPNFGPLLPRYFLAISTCNPLCRRPGIRGGQNIRNAGGGTPESCPWKAWTFDPQIEDSLTPRTSKFPPPL